MSFFIVSSFLVALRPLGLGSFYLFVFILCSKLYVLTYFISFDSG